MPSWTRVAGTSECQPGELRNVMAEGLAIVLANVDGDVYALEDQCSHDEFPLSDGELEDGDVVCTYHGARFDACTGKNKSLPAIRPVRSFPVEIRGDDIYVDVG